jgi:hypothetical protein
MDTEPHYRPGDAVNGYRLSADGSRWEPVEPATPVPGAPPQPRPTRAGFLPTGRAGWWALIITAVGLGSWLVLPIVTTVFRERYPVTDTVLMPIIGLGLTLVAALVNVLVVWRARERSVLNILAMVFTLAAGAFFGAFLIGEGLAGA